MFFLFLIKQLDFVCNDIASMSESCENIKSRLKVMDFDSNSFL
jgi:hypothetical protein